MLRKWQTGHCPDQRAQLGADGAKPPIRILGRCPANLLLWMKGVVRSSLHLTLGTPPLRGHPFLPRPDLPGRGHRTHGWLVEWTQPQGWHPAERIPSLLQAQVWQLQCHITQMSPLGRGLGAPVHTLTLPGENQAAGMSHPGSLRVHVFQPHALPRGTLTGECPAQRMRHGLRTGATIRAGTASTAPRVEGLLGSSPRAGAQWKPSGGGPPINGAPPPFVVLLVRKCFVGG